MVTHCARSMFLPTAQDPCPPIAQYPCPPTTEDPCPPLKHAQYILKSMEADHCRVLPTGRGKHGTQLSTMELNMKTQTHTSQNSSAHQKTMSTTIHQTLQGSTEVVASLCFLTKLSCRQSDIKKHNFQQIFTARGANCFKSKTILINHVSLQHPMLSTRKSWNTSAWHQPFKKQDLHSSTTFRNPVI